METTPYAKLNRESQNNSFYSLGLSLGSKLRLAGPVSVFGEVSHYFFTSAPDTRVYYGPALNGLGREYDFEHNPTYLSVGLTYSIHAGK